jgi:hypothetical protein
MKLRNVGCPIVEFDRSGLVTGLPVEPAGVCLPPPGRPPPLVRIDDDDDDEEDGDGEVEGNAV